jgi:hypothetical protein
VADGVPAVRTICGGTKTTRNSPSGAYREHFQKTTTLNNQKDRPMTTTSGLARTVSATRRGGGMEASVHLSPDESQAMIPPLILELFGRISRRAALLEGAFVGPAHSSDDLAALAWIQQSLEDVEATIIGLLEANRRSAAIHGPAPSFAGCLVP